MARTLIILILMLLAPIITAPVTAGAWDLIRARIISIDNKTDGIVSLKVRPETIADSEQNGETLEIEIDSHELPAEIKPGDSIRIWQNSDNDGSRIVHISPSRGFDATGVRSRLGGRGRSGGRGRGGSGHGGGGGR